jgi:hypothetical protein
MRLAVVIPSYNHAHYIGLALESVLQQTRRPDRIIVIDDGSKDHSVEFLKTFESRGVEVLARENRGAHNTINQAIAMAATDCELISILNSDDHYHRERFARCVPLLEQHPERSVICTGLQIIDSDNQPLPLTEPRARWFRAIWSWQQKEDLDYCEWLGLGNFPATTSNIIARREFLLRFPFRPYRYNHDYYFLAQTVLRNQMLVLPEPLINYRVHATNTMNTKPVYLMREMVRMHLDLLHDLAPELAHDTELRSALMRYLRSSWQNISALPTGVLQVLLATAAGRFDEAEIAALAESLTEEAWPEMREFPNKGLVNTHDGITPIGAESGLSDKLSSAKAERKLAQENAKAWKELSKLQANMAESRWIAFGRLCGAKFPTAGNTPSEKLQALQASLQQSFWGKRSKLF